MFIKRAVLASVVIIFGSVTIQFLNSGENIPPKKPFHAFPKNIGTWTGEESRFKNEVYDILGVEESFLGNYTSSNGGQVQLYVGYYESQRKGDLIHSPRNCMPGAGWKIIQSGFTEIPRLNAQPARVIKLTLQKGNQKQLMLYWFHSRGRIIASEYWQKIFLVWDSIVKHRTDGSFVRLITPTSEGDEYQALENLFDFAERLFPILDDFIPS